MPDKNGKASAKVRANNREGEPVVTMALLPGQCFLFDGRVLHGSSPNHRPGRRAGLVGRFIPAETHLAGLESPFIAVAGDPSGTVHRLVPPP